MYSPDSSARNPGTMYKDWNVSDSFKVTKLKVTSREAIKKQKEMEQQLSKDRANTSDAKSYLKSRRKKARDERRSDILSMLDQKLEKIAPTSQDPSSPTKPASKESRSKWQYRVATSEQKNISSSGHGSGSTGESQRSPTITSPKQQNRLRVLNPFRNRSKDNDGEQDTHRRSESRGTGRLDQLIRTKSDRRTTRRRKEQVEAVEVVKNGNKDKEAEMNEILVAVLQKYPKERCKTFADHKEFAFAELTTQSNHRKDLQITTEKFNDLKSKLQSHLANTLAADVFGTDSEKNQGYANERHGLQLRQSSQRTQNHYSSGQPRNQQQHSQSSDLQTSRLSTSPRRHYERRSVQVTEDMQSPRKTGHQHHNLHLRSTGSSSPRSSKSHISSSTPASPQKWVSSLPREVSPGRMRSGVPPPGLTSSPQPKSPSSSWSKEWEGINSPQEEHNRAVSKSSTSLSLPKPRSTSLDDHLPSKGMPSEKDSSTTITELDDESTLVPVVKLLIVDPSGNIGKYTGTICVNTGKPHGSGRLEYEASGSYNGDWNQGNWSGYGRQAKPNGDIYEGNFFDNTMHGMGTYRYRDGKRIFEGRYVMGQRVDGQMTYGDGSVYKGQWYDGKRHGRGTYRFKDSSIYKGEFLQDVIHGVGQLVWPDGAKYVGEWNQGHRHGLGKEFTHDGRLRYEGKWKGSVPVS